MEFKKCKRCGCFFVSTNEVCEKCFEIDNNEVSKLKNFLAENNNVSSLQEISYATNISESNLNRHIEKNNLENIFNNFN